MSMQVPISLKIETTMYQLEEAQLAENRAGENDGVVYSWKTTGRSNWLERGFSISDVLGLVVLPAGLPGMIEMPEDDREVKYPAAE